MILIWNEECEIYFSKYDFLNGTSQYFTSDDIENYYTENLNEFMIRNYLNLSNYEIENLKKTFDCTIYMETDINDKVFTFLYYWDIWQLHYLISF